MRAVESVLEWRESSFPCWCVVLRVRRGGCGGGRGNVGGRSAQATGSKVRRVTGVTKINIFEVLGLIIGVGLRVPSTLRPREPQEERGSVRCPKL